MQGEAQQISQADAYMAGYMNKEAGPMDNIVNAWVRYKQEKHPETLIPERPRSVALKAVLDHLSSDLTADLGDKLRGKKFKLGTKTSLTSLKDPSFIKRLPLRKSFDEKMQDRVSDAIKKAPAVVVPPPGVESLEKAAAAGYMMGYLEKDAAWYEDAWQTAKDWWAGKTDQERRNLMLTAGGGLAGALGGGYLGGWKGALAGGVGGVALGYGGGKAYDWWNQRQAGNEIKKQVEGGPKVLSTPTPTDINSFKPQESPVFGANQTATV